MSHLPFFSTDHAPLYVQFSPVRGNNTSRRPFRFEAAWMSHRSFKKLLETSWKSDLTTPEALDELRVKLKKWNKDVFGDVMRRKDALLDKIKIVHDQLDLAQTDVLLTKEASLIKELEEVLEQEEILWFQK